MSDCTQGELNRQAFENLEAVLETRNAEYHELSKCVMSINETVLKMDGKLDMALERTARNERALDKHLEDSATRIDAIKENTAFRKVGVWVVMISFTVINLVIKYL